MAKYNPIESERKWQKKWEESGLYTCDLNDESKPKFYNLVMFPYPSGDKLHIGHWYNFAPADSFGRYMRMKGYNVFEPMGFDAFGLPAENYAIKTGVHPSKSIKMNVETMIKQLKRIGTMYDWSKTVNTSSPEYYKWTQWVFLQLFKKGLAYQREASVNWDPVDQTVLANEQVLPDGTAERSGAVVEQKLLKQWFFKITAYAQRLLDGLESLDWPSKTKNMQQNWIGRSEGAHIVFQAEDVPDDEGEITVFTTRPDTLFGATYMVFAPEHPLVAKITSDKQRPAVEKYIKEVGTKSELQRTDLEKDKTGVFTGGYAINPVNGDKIPVWIADYVLMSYGTGAIMAVPGHDERDYEFARKYEIPIKQVVKGGDIAEGAFTEEGEAMNSGFLDGLKTPKAKKAMIKWLEEENLGTGVVQYRLRDWLLSRQRYWGAPIPIVYDPSGNPHPVPDEHLPWLLPEDVEFKPTGTSPLGQSAELVERTEAIFGKGWKPEIDTMDTFVCSSFYYLRYLMAGSAEGEERFINLDREKKWMPVDMYIGGPEHACMHLIYARFINMALKDCGFAVHDEPFRRLVHQGLITKDGAKMSKSKGNVVSPDEFICEYGSDVFRMYLMFMGPFEDGGDWNDKGITGVARFVDRFYNLLCSESTVSDESAASRNVHSTIKKVGADIERMNFNTAISALMEFVNTGMKVGIAEIDKESIVKLIAPLAPHLAEEIWSVLGFKDSIFNSGWPEYDENLLVADTIRIVVQINGKVRGNVDVPVDADEQAVVSAALRVENVERFLEGVEIVKRIYIPGKLISFVVKPS
jgi:leucyl-tRNA synthetase